MTDGDENEQGCRAGWRRRCRRDTHASISWRLATTLHDESWVVTCCQQRIADCYYSRLCYFFADSFHILQTIWYRIVYRRFVSPREWPILRCVFLLLTLNPISLHERNTNNIDRPNNWKLYEKFEWSLSAICYYFVEVQIWKCFFAK